MYSVNTLKDGFHFLMVDTYPKAIRIAKKYGTENSIEKYRPRIDRINPCPVCGKDEGVGTECMGHYAIECDNCGAITDWACWYNEYSPEETWNSVIKWWNDGKAEIWKGDKK